MVVCRSLELAQTQPPKHAVQPQDLSNDRISGMKNSSFSGQDLLERSLWSTLLLEAMCVSEACATPRGQVDICSLCYRRRPY